jgi:hypothetical protein
MVQWVFRKFASFARELCEKEQMGTQCDRASLYLLTGIISMLWLYMMFYFVKQLIETGKYVLLIVVWITVLALWTYIWLSSIIAVRELEGLASNTRG